MAAARFWFTQHITAATTVDPIYFDLVLIGLPLTLMLCVWFWTLGTFSKITWQMAIGVFYGVLAVMATQLFFMAFESVLHLNPNFFNSLSQIIGNKTTALLQNTTMFASFQQ
jgi:hypothetical protein